MNAFFNFGKIIQSFISTDESSNKIPVITAGFSAAAASSVKIPQKKKNNSGNIFSSLLTLNPQNNTPGFFLRNLCAGIHSIEISSAGYMFIGSLGNHSSEVGKKSLKKIYKISPYGIVNEIAQVECQFITAITSDSKGILFFATLEELQGKVYKINNEREIIEIASGFSEIYTLKADHNGNLLVGTDKIYLINEKGEKSVFIADKGVVDFDKEYRNLFMGTIDGNELYQYPVSNGTSSIASTFFEGLQGIKCLAVSPNGKIIVLSYNNGDLLTVIDKGKIIRQIAINIDLPQIFLPRRYVLTNMAVGKKGFDNYSVYITTWTGDIIKINTGFNLAGSDTGN